MRTIDEFPKAAKSKIHCKKDKGKIQHIKAGIKQKTEYP